MSTLRSYLRKALASKTQGDAVADAITPMANIPVIGTTTNLPAAACAGGTTPSATNVNTAIDALRVPVEARLDVLEAKVDAILAGLKSTGKMS